MEDFPKLLLAGLFLFLFWFVVVIIKAYLRNSPLSRKEELIKYHRYLVKPVGWSFVAMFVLVLLFGVLMSKDWLAVLQRATVAGWLTAGGIYVFMIWGANLIRNK
ncbi:MAG: hypothetical protein KDC54_06655 [Lewinella sp.]|nr:hypothetical protein [Lewinella sp.]